MVASTSRPCQRKLGGPLLAEDPERAANDGIVLHFLRMLIEEDQ